MSTMLLPFTSGADLHLSITSGTIVAPKSKLKIQHSCYQGMLEHFLPWHPVSRQTAVKSHGVKWLKLYK